MDKTPFFQNTFSKWEKILDKLPHRSYFKSDKDDKNKNNLSDGKNQAGSSGKNKIKIKEDDKQIEDNNDELSKAKANVEQSGVEVDEDQTEVEEADAAQFNK